MSTDPRGSKAAGLGPSNLASKLKFIIARVGKAQWLATSGNTQTAGLAIQCSGPGMQHCFNEENRDSQPTFPRISECRSCQGTAEPSCQDLSPECIRLSLRCSVSLRHLGNLGMSSQCTRVLEVIHVILQNNILENFSSCASCLQMPIV